MLPPEYYIFSAMSSVYCFNKVEMFVLASMKSDKHRNFDINLSTELSTKDLIVNRFMFSSFQNIFFVAAFRF